MTKITDTEINPFACSRDLVMALSTTDKTRIFLQKPAIAAMHGPHSVFDIVTVLLYTVMQEVFVVG